MAERTFYLELATPNDLIHQGEVTALVVPAAEGFLGVLAGHAPLRAALTMGRLRFDPIKGGPRWFEVIGGLLDVARDRVTILADAASPLVQADVEKA